MAPRTYDGRQRSTFAIVFDLDASILDSVYEGGSRNTALSDVRRFLERRGFTRQQGPVCFRDETIDAISCVLAIQDLTVEFEWFASAARDLRMLRIEESCDLMPAVKRAMRRKPY